MKKVLLCLGAVAMVFAMVTSAGAFDGNRKGFVIGGGLGFAPTATWKSDPVTIDFGFGTYTYKLDESNSAVALNLLLGYAWDEHNMIVYEGNVVGYKVGNADVSQGFNGASWYHYFGPVGKSAFLTAGLGVYVLQVEGDDADMGGALQFGGGYEFARHWQVGGYLGFGKTKDPDISGLDYTHMHFSILVGGVAF